MWPDLSYLFHDLFGTSRDNWISIFKTYGFFLLIAFLVAAYLLRLELRRREKIGQISGKAETVAAGAGMRPVDYFFNGLFGFILGYKLPYAIGNMDEWRGDPSAVLLNAEGNFLVGILVAAAFLGYYYWLDQRAKKENPTPRTVDVMPSDRIAPITFAAAIGGLVGAKVFAILEYLPDFFQDPVGTFFSGSGLAIYGGLIGGFVTVFWYLHRHDIPKLPFMDAVAPGLMAAYGVGRVGCQLSGDGDWGVVAPPQPDWWFLPDWMWAYDFPHNVINGGDAATVQIADCASRYCTRLAEGHYPTSIYEVIMAFSIAAILWSLRKRLTALPGVLFAVYLVLNGIERFLIEYIRVNDKYDILGLSLTQAQLIAIGFMASGLAFGLYLNSTYQKQRDAPPN